MYLELLGKYQGRRIIEALRRSRSFENGEEVKWTVWENLFPSFEKASTDPLFHKIDRDQRRRDRFLFRTPEEHNWNARLGVFKETLSTYQERLVRHSVGEDGALERYFPDGVGGIEVILRKYVLVEKREWIFWGEKTKDWAEDGSSISIGGEQYKETIDEKAGIDPLGEYSVVTVFTRRCSAKTEGAFVKKFFEELWVNPTTSS